MAPQVDVTWAAKYFEILVTLLVFAFGISALAFQISVTEDIRRIVHRQLKRLILRLLPFAFAPGLGALVVLWALHPGVAQPLNNSHLLTAACIVTVCLLAALIVWGRSLSLRAREQVVSILTGILIRRARRGEWMPLQDRDLEDLVYLGSVGKPGREKDDVTQALSKLCIAVVERPEYRGGDLDPWLDRFVAVVAAKTLPGTEGNFYRAADALKGLRHALQERCYSSSYDYQRIGKTLGKLSMAATEQGHTGPAVSCIEAVAAESGVLLEVGKAAALANQYAPALTALHKLECLAEEKGMKHCREVYDLLGLLALWADDDATRQHAKEYVSEFKSFFRPSFDECVQKAGDYHYQGARFDVAYKVRRLIKNLQK